MLLAVRLSTADISLATAFSAQRMISTVIGSTDIFRFPWIVQAVQIVQDVQTVEELCSTFVNSVQCLPRHPEALRHAQVPLVESKQPKCCWKNPTQVFLPQSKIQNLS